LLAGAKMAKDSAGRKLPWFKLWPRDFMSDPVIQAMSFDKRGRFIWACMCSWETDTPGMATENQWRKWLGYSIDGWEANRLDFPLIPGEMGELLVQKRLLYEFQQTRQEMERRSNAGLTGAKARWGADAVALPSHSGRNGNPSEGRRQRAEKEESTPLATIVAVNGVSLNGKSNGNGHHDPEDRDWAGMFEWFYEKFPKKVGRPAAEKAWRAIKPQNQETVEAIGAGLDLWLGSWSLKEKQFIPYPATWLNQRRWENQP